MRQSKFFMPTLKEAPSDAVAKSHQLMLRGGYIRQVTAGVYAYLPLGYRVLRKAENIIEEEMDNINVPEMIMPHLLPATLWQESGRYKKYGAEMFKLQDRHGRESLLGPTHEETFTEIVAKNLKSYKQMPLALYQIQTKFRDENRPRFGLLRGREFVMLDGYSFAATREQLDEQFDDQKSAYLKIFNRAGVTVHPVIADSGTMGGKNSTEFQAPAAIGEDTIATNEKGTYAANLEMAKSIDTFKQEPEEAKDLAKVATPGMDTIEKLADFLKVPSTRIVKSILYIADDQKVLVLIRGDKEINEVKLGHILDADEVRTANADELVEITGSEKGGVGPINADWADKIIADETVKDLYNVVVGANETDYQYQNANLDRDFKVDEFADIRTANEGEPDPVDHLPLKFTTSIEVGHIFKLGTYYTDTMGADFLDNNGKAKPVIMGSYGIGVTRMLSAAVEQHLTENGIAWPKEIAPFAIHLIQMKMKDETQTKLAEKLEKELSAKYDVLYDDRNERPGVKFNDADLVGAPLRITIGRKAKDGIVEVKRPMDEKATEVNISDLDAVITKELG
ncbi:proline--tRNA ligase [Lactobacillus johnsonii]|uniref:Proline--tRNA ligase n=2 Tax=Lactobacillus johnsonii TaxID=33959 RepID=SYP_LACJO|nr:proline--tRNA ligase [Lactobacillus johnsonii]Q74IS2.1 RecName: Full=Proline--tRNA ligase; AltName: Full=Prolyl-tRNA synthetase; Short=ProRS [Lactobacillus johnsonii NCC 533]AAS09261.1 prolyl-tRNA synthetase [Lactobacillus johnsonii NCC 533]AOG25448.1 proline--tRNA ligase [Lactobacillus johnsonii]MCT3321273.1 proline--tRNA ligase [Lactobacillus johnsonii]MCT3340100.1 proline--tRNA ligase [Lactobacillus johnsonii]MCT3389768.1 proline--tRNA ligase [Lactobacillus johnsonii]